MSFLNPEIAANASKAGELAAAAAAKVANKAKTVAEHATEGVVKPSAVQKQTGAAAPPIPKRLTTAQTSSAVVAPPKDTFSAKEAPKPYTHTPDPGDKVEVNGAASQQVKKTPPPPPPRKVKAIENNTPTPVSDQPPPRPPRGQATSPTQQSATFDTPLSPPPRPVRLTAPQAKKLPLAETQAIMAPKQAVLTDVSMDSPPPLPPRELPKAAPNIQPPKQEISASQLSLTERQNNADRKYLEKWKKLNPGKEFPAELQMVKARVATNQRIEELEKDITDFRNNGYGGIADALEKNKQQLEIDQHVKNRDELMAAAAPEAQGKTPSKFSWLSLKRKPATEAADLASSAETSAVTTKKSEGGTFKRFFGLRKSSSPVTAGSSKQLSASAAESVESPVVSTISEEKIKPGLAAAQKELKASEQELRRANRDVAQTLKQHEALNKRLEQSFSPPLSEEEEAALSADLAALAREGSESPKVAPQVPTRKPAAKLPTNSASTAKPAPKLPTTLASTAKAAPKKSFAELQVDSWNHNAALTRESTTTNQAYINAVRSKQTDVADALKAKRDQLSNARKEHTQAYSEFVEAVRKGDKQETQAKYDAWQQTMRTQKAMLDRFDDDLL